MSSLKLIYVKPLGKNAEEKYEYELYFSENPDDVWEKDWDDPNPSICGDITPSEEQYEKIVRVKSELKWKTVEETSCYSMEYSIEGVTALSWIDIEGLEEYPSNGRLVFHFGDDYSYVESQLSLYEIFIDDKDDDYGEEF